MRSRFLAWPVAVIAIAAFSQNSLGQEKGSATPGRAVAYVPFDGEKTTWHDGFDRYDFVMDEESLAIKPFKQWFPQKTALHPAPRIA